jgi:hypothetical protein
MNMCISSERILTELQTARAEYTKVSMEYYRAIRIRENLAGTDNEARAEDYARGRSQVCKTAKVRALVWLELAKEFNLA